MAKTREDAIMDYLWENCRGQNNAREFSEILLDLNASASSAKWAAYSHALAKVIKRHQHTWAKEDKFGRIYWATAEERSVA